jgi:hypothetical protein
LGDSILLELLIEVASRSVDDLRGLGDVPGVVAQLLYQVRALGRVLELAKRAAG